MLLTLVHHVGPQNATRRPLESKTKWLCDQELALATDSSKPRFLREALPCCSVSPKPCLLESAETSWKCRIHEGGCKHETNDTDSGDDSLMVLPSPVLDGAVVVKGSDSPNAGSFSKTRHRNPLLVRASASASPPIPPPSTAISIRSSRSASILALAAIGGRMFSLPSPTPAKINTTRTLHVTSNRASEP